MAWGRVQGNQAASGNVNATTIAVTISAVGSGNDVCGIVSWDLAGSVALNSVTDDKGNAYNREIAIDDTTNNQRSCAFSRTNITNVPVTITANFASSIGFRGIIVDEFSGGSTASTDERDGTAHGGQFQNAPGTGTDAITSGTFTTATNGCLLYGACMGGGTVTNASNGTSFSTGTSMVSSDYSMQSEYRTQVTAGSGTAATLTQAVASQRVTFLIALKPSGVGASIPNKIYQSNQAAKRAAYY